MPRNRYARRLLVALGLFISVFALGVRPAFATHFRYAAVYWQRNLSYSNPLKPTEAKITITIQVGMRWTYPSFTYTADGPVPGAATTACAGVVTTATDWQQGFGTSCPPLGAYLLPTGSLGYGLTFNKAVTVVAENGKTLAVPASLSATSSPAPGFGYPFHAIVTTLIPSQDLFYAQGTLDVLVDMANATAASPLVATWEDANRLSTLLDGNNDIPWIVGTAINLSFPVTKSPQSVSNPVVQVSTGVANTISLPVQVFDNMIAHYRVATSAESGLTSPQPVSPSAFSLNQQTGQITFTPRTNGLYAVQFKVGAYDTNNVLQNEVPLDMIFQAVPATATYSLGLATGDGQTTYTATVPQPFSFTVNATLTPPNAAYTVAINNTVLPTGATFTQASGTGAGPVTGTFNWTPTVNSTSTLICFGATATNGQTLVAQSAGSKCVEINLNPLATALTALPASGDGGGPLTLSAKLTRVLDGAPLPGRAINFSWSDPTNPPWVADCPPVTTDTNGVATCVVQTTRTVSSGTYNVAFNAINNELVQSSAAAGTVVIKSATTTLDPPTAPTTPYNSIGYPVTVSDVLNRVDSDGGKFPPPGQVVQFTLTDPNNTPTVLTAAVAGSQGVASVTFPADTASVLGNYMISGYFAGNDLLNGNVTSATTTFAMGQRLKLTVSPATGGANLPTTLRARLTDDPQATPVTGKVVSFTVGTTTLQGTTDGDGWAQATGTFPNVGTFPFSVSFTPTASLNELNSQGLRAAETASGTATITPAVATVLTTSAFAGTSWTPAALTAQLATSPTGAPVSGMQVTFTVGGVTLGTAATDTNGVASLAITPTGKVSGQYTAAFAGETGVYLSSSSTSSYSIANAPSATAISCASAVTFNGMTQMPCSATVTGAGALSQPVTVTYTNNVNAGTATASASFAGDSSHDGSTASKTFTISPAASATVVTCPSASPIYNGSAQTPCSATATGDGGLNVTLPVTYANNINAGSAAASASFAGDANHSGSNGSATFTIGVAATTTVVVCPATPVAFTGAALTPCTATATGDGALNQTLSVTYANNTNAGSASASASFAGDANHSGSNGTATFTIGLAATTTVVTCPAAVTFTGLALTPCSATVTGAGGLNQTAAVTYANNVAAGSASATANFAGDGNHSSSNGTATFTIGVAATTTVVTCPAAVTFTGLALTPCSATVTGAGGLNQTAAVTYANNVAAGGASATASFAGDTNHGASTGTATFTIGPAASTIVVTCPAASVVFTGAAQTPCSATVTGDGGLNQSLSVSYTNNVNAGSASATASYAGDANHSSGTGAAGFTIGVAASTTVVSCPTTVIFNGSAQTPCTATVTGDGGLTQSPTVTYTNNTNAGPASAGASFAGDANHAASSGSATFTIGRAASTTVVACPATVTFNGSALTPCTATVTGDGGLTQSPTVTYTNNTNAGPASASASFAGDANHAASSGSATFTIGLAASTTVVTCPAAPVPFSGAAQTPCSATVTGDGGLTQSLSVSYTNNTAAGLASAGASFAGDTNHTNSTGSATFAIGKAASTTVVTCPASVPFNGSAETPCTAGVTGAGGLTQSLTVTYASNTVAGSASASASYTGDANHDPSSGSTTFAINPAASAIAVSCPASVTFNGSAQTPCTATVTGDGGLSQPVTVSYTGNINAGTANASAAYAGDANHAPATSSATFSIAKASSAVTFSCPASIVYSGTAQTPCTATATAADGLSQPLTVTVANNVNAGTASASASFTGDANHTGSSGSATFTIAPAATVTVVTCPVSVTYTGAVQTPCGALATGAGGLSQAVGVSYANNTNAGTASATASFAGDPNHAGSTGAAAFVIAKRTPTITWATPAAINQGAKLGTKQLNATASVPGTFVYSPAAGTVLGPGTQTLSVTFTPTDQANNTTATASVSITVDATGSVNVGPGQTVTYNGGSVAQSVTVNGGTLILTNGAHVGGQVTVLAGSIVTSNSTVAGALEIGGASTFNIGPGTVVAGDLLVGLMPESTTVNTVCGAQVKGNVDYGAAGAPVVFGSPAAGCAGNVITGQLLINATNAPVEVFGNQIGQQLECTLNATITGGGNTARQKLGQCSAF